MALVAVKAAGAALVAMAGIGVDGGDHPVGGDLTGDPEHPLAAQFQILAHHRRHQPRGLGHRRGQRAALKGSEHRTGILGTRIHQHRPGRLVVPVDLRLGQTGVVLAAGKHPSQLSRQRLVAHLEQAPDGRAQQRDRVHGRHCVIQRGGVQHPPHPHQPSLAGRSHRDRKDPLRPGRGGQPRPHVHQHGMTEAGVVERQPTTGVLPARVEAERLDRLAVRQTLQPLQHHHRGHDPRGHAAPADLGEQVSEQLIGKQPVALAVQHRQIDCCPTRPSHTAAVPAHRSACLGVVPAVIGHSR